MTQGRPPLRGRPDGAKPGARCEPETWPPHPCSVDVAHEFYTARSSAPPGNESIIVLDGMLYLPPPEGDRPARPPLPKALNMDFIALQIGAVFSLVGRCLRL